jgi:hypothetical protein
MITLNEEIAEFCADLINVDIEIGSRKRYLMHKSLYRIIKMNMNEIEVDDITKYEQILYDKQTRVIGFLKNNKIDELNLRRKDTEVENGDVIIDDVIKKEVITICENKEMFIKLLSLKYSIVEESIENVHAMIDLNKSRIIWSKHYCSFSGIIAILNNIIKIFGQRIE